jgi:hypothetical protein
LTIDYLFIPFQVKINGSNDEMLRAAAEQFGDKSVDEIMYGKNLILSFLVA